VLVAGGSQPEGYLLDQATFWPGRLQTLLRTRERLRTLDATRVHVGSIARSGVGSEGLNLIFAKVLGRYPRLDMIIILVGASDMLRWLEAGAPSTPPPVNICDTFRWHPETTFSWKPKQLALFELLARMRQRWFRRVEFQDRACKWIGRARAMRTNAREILIAVPDPSPMLRHFDAQFREAIARAKAHADRVLIVRQPWFDRPCTPEEAAQMWHGGTGQAWREQVTSFYSHEVLMHLMSQLDARASAAARELEVEQLDVRAVLEPGVSTYYDFFHLTPAGAARIADAIAAAVVRQPAAADDAEESSEFQRKVS
jgi:lysophospholipase L1-like esterase